MRKVVYISILCAVLLGGVALGGILVMGYSDRTDYTSYVEAFRYKMNQSPQVVAGSIFSWSEDEIGDYLTAIANEVAFGVIGSVEVRLWGTSHITGENEFYETPIIAEPVRRGSSAHRLLDETFFVPNPTFTHNGMHNGMFVIFHP